MIYISVVIWVCLQKTNFQSVWFLILQITGILLILVVIISILVTYVKTRKCKCGEAKLNKFLYYLNSFLPFVVVIIFFALVGVCIVSIYNTSTSNYIVNLILLLGIIIFIWLITIYLYDLCLELNTCRKSLEMKDCKKNCNAKV